jgi:hypothetical protein
MTPTRRNKARLGITAFGIFLPYLARIPGIATRGLGWLTQITDGGIVGILFIGLFNAVLWGGVLAATASYRHLRSYAIPVVLGYCLPFYAYARVDLASSSTAAIALVFIPLESLPLVFVGFLLGRWYDQRLSQ